MVKLIELHVHLDGAIRHKTLFELSKQKGVDLGNSPEEVRKLLVHSDPCKNLEEFLAPFKLWYSCLVGDIDVIERIAFELCETQAQNNVIYFETRYCPHLLANTTTDHEVNLGVYHDKGPVEPEDVVRAVNRGLARGETQFGVKARSILTTFPGKLAITRDLVQFCKKYKNDGVVGIDTAQLPNLSITDEVPTAVEEMKLFAEARDAGIHRTIHAGESGPADEVKRAIENFHAERIGHGYRVISDAEIYAMARQKGVHFECCPWSSLLTAAVTCDWKDHALAIFHRDGANFGLSTDDPTITGTLMADEVKLVQTKLGWTDDDIRKLQVNAAKSAFLPENEKDELISLLC